MERQYITLEQFSSSDQTSAEGLVEDSSFLKSFRDVFFKCKPVYLLTKSQRAHFWPMPNGNPNNNEIMSS